jgi:hypothetical protein
MGFLVLGAEAEDYVASSTITASSEEAAPFEADNLKTLPAGKRTHTLDTVLAATWLFDLGAAHKVSLAVVLAHNFTEDVVITLKAGSTSGVSELTRNIPWRDFGAFTVMPEAQNYRYWQLEVSDAGNADGFLAFGRMLLIEALQLHDFNFAFGWKRTKKATNLTQRTPFGVPHIDKRYKQTEVWLPFHSIPKASLPELDAFLEALDGNAEAAFVIPDPAEYEGYLSRLESDYEVTFQNHAYRDIDGLLFVEDPKYIPLR